MEENYFVSVIIPTYKRPDTLDRAINSVLAQTYPYVEVIVVDDNNPDTEGRRLTEEKMAPYSDNPRVKYIKHEKNKNGSAARNTGAKASNAKYLAFLDDDDEFFPEKIDAQVKRLEELPIDYAVCYTYVVYEKENGQIRYSTECREGDLFFDALTRNLSFQTVELICAIGDTEIDGKPYSEIVKVAKDYIDSIGGFDESFRRSQDKEVVTRLLKDYKIAFAPVKGVHAHVYEDHSFFNPLEITDYYVEKMQHFVDSLPINQKVSYYKEINKQRFYYAVTSKNNSKAMKLILSGKVSLLSAFRIIYNGIRRKYCNNDSNNNSI